MVRDVTDGTSKTLVATGNAGGEFTAMTTSSNVQLLATGDRNGVRHFPTARWAHYKYTFNRVCASGMLTQVNWWRHCQGTEIMWEILHSPPIRTG